jgi:hypothetical protein
MCAGGATGAAMAGYSYQPIAYAAATVIALLGLAVAWVGTEAT